MLNNKFNLSLFSLILSIFIDSIGWGLLFPVLTHLIIHNGSHLFSANTSYATRSLWFELLIGCYCFAMFLSSPILGSWSDNIGRKKVIIVSLLGAMLGFVCCGTGVWCNSLAALMIGRLIAGFTAGNFSVAQASIIDMSSESQVTQRIGHFLMANSIGFAIGPALGTLLLKVTHGNPWSNYVPFIFLAVLFLLGTIFISICFKETYSAPEKKKIRWLTSLTSVTAAFSKKQNRWFFITFLIFMLGFSLFFCNIPVYIVGIFNQNASNSGLLMTYFSIMTLIGLYVILPYCNKHYTLSSVMMISLLVSVITYLIFPWISSWPLLWLVLAPTGLAEPLVYVSIVTLISNNTSKAEQGKVMGLVGSIGALSWGLGPLLSGLFVLVNIHTALIASAVLITLSYVCGFKANRTRG